MIYLYHGTDAEIDSPIPAKGRRGTDFGQGFYLTPDILSALIGLSYDTQDIKY